MRIYGLVGVQDGKSGLDEKLLQALNDRLSQKALNVLLGGNADSLSGREAVLARCAFCCTFRLVFVDKWIDSGRTEEGEQPWDRKYFPGILRDYVERNPPVLEQGGDSPYFSFFPRNWDRQKLPSAYLKPLMQEIFSRVGQSDPTSARFLLRIMPLTWDVAAGMFLQLLDSPGRVRLFRCDGCGTYFLRRRMPRKNTRIHRGSYCTACKSEGKDSVHRTELAREGRTRKMVGWAADALLRWKPGRRCGELVPWIKQNVNSNLPVGRRAISRNWVTKHLAEIEAEAERRKDAKG